MPLISTNIATRVASMLLNGPDQSAPISKVASGSRITKASDDAAGLAIATQLSGNLAALGQASTNAAQASSVLQAAGGGLSAIGGVLQRMKSLATQAASGNVTDSQRTTAIQTEFSQLKNQIDQIASGTRYSGQSLLNGTGPLASGANFVVGTSASDTVSVKLGDATSGASGFNITGDVTTQSNAQTMMNTLDQAINTLNTQQAAIGAYQSQMGAASQSIAVNGETTTAANAAVSGADIALQKVKMSTSSVLAQSHIAALTQANKMSQHVVKLLNS